MKQFLAKAVLGMLGSSAGMMIAPPLAPVTGAIGSTIAEFLFDEGEFFPDSDALAETFVVRVILYTVAGTFGECVGEFLSGPLGGIIDAAEDKLAPGEITTAILLTAHNDQKVIKVLEEIPKVIQELPLPKWMQDRIAKQYFDSLVNAVYILGGEGKLEEWLGKSVGKDAFKKVILNECVSEVLIDQIKLQKRVELARVALEAI